VLEIIFFNRPRTCVLSDLHFVQTIGIIKKYNDFQYESLKIAFKFDLLPFFYLYLLSGCFGLCVNCLSMGERAKMYFPLEVSEIMHAFMLTHFVLSCGVSWDSSWLLLDVFIKCATTWWGFSHIFGLFYCNNMPSSLKSPQSQKTLGTEDVLEWFKLYLDQKFESLV